MAKVTQGLNLSGYTGQRSGVVVKPQRTRDESGALQAQVSAGSVSQVLWQARLHKDFGWVTLWDSNADGGFASLTSGTEFIATELPVMPFIRARVVGALGATFNIYYME